MDIEYTLFDDPEQYSTILAEVSVLYSTVFKKVFPCNAWKQWYLMNPAGNPYVAIGRAPNGQMIGHHALVPQILIRRSKNDLRYFLSMGTMVHPRYRGLQVFLRLADMLHEVIKTLDGFFVIAFPNAISAPLFATVYGYEVILQTMLCNVSVQEGSRTNCWDNVSASSLTPDSELYVAAYSASKGALVSLTKALAVELSRTQIRVNCVVPGLVLTDMGRRLLEMLTLEQRAALETKHLLGLGNARDVANAIAFLLSDSARWITGSVLVVDGGYSAH